MSIANELVSEIAVLYEFMAGEVELSWWLIWWFMLLKMRKSMA